MVFYNNLFTFFNCADIIHWSIILVFVLYKENCFREDHDIVLIYSILRMRCYFTTNIKIMDRFLELIKDKKEHEKDERH